MKVTTIDATLFKTMVKAGQQRLNANAEYVNSLNVFPVPDGDTGTNMNLTMTSGDEATQKAATEHVGELNRIFAKGLLMGARGNSGVILSQLFRGFSKEVEADATLTAERLAAAFIHGVEIAYKAVMKPVEGTILTVAREAALAGEAKSKESDDCVAVMQAVVARAKEALANTTNQLPVLKEVGLVDSGGQGLLFIYEGFLAALTGDTDIKIHQPDAKEVEQMVLVQHDRAQDHFVTEDIQYGYCTEIMVRLNEGPTVCDTFDYDTFRSYLNDLGDSLLVVADDEVIKVHVHTEDPGKVLSYGLRFGSLIKIKVDNMRLQHETILEMDTQEVVKEKEALPMAVLTIVAGKGVQDLFYNLGATTVINGGQTMNPSTEDILKAIEETQAEEVLILPNNKNIFMAAEQAAEVCARPVSVVPSKTISQGMNAMLQFDPHQSLVANAEAMTEALTEIKSGQVTTAVRDTTIDGLAIHKDEYIGMFENKIVVANADRVAAVLQTIEKMLDEDSEIITLLIGETGSQKEAEQIEAQLLERHPDLEVEVHQGDQPVYPYVFSVE